jgi:hypothetical protein
VCSLALPYLVSARPTSTGKDEEHSGALKKGGKFRFQQSGRRSNELHISSGCKKGAGVLASSLLTIRLTIIDNPADNHSAFIPATYADLV